MRTRSKNNPELDLLREQNEKVQEYRLTYDKMLGVGSREISIRMGPDDFVHMGREELRMILNKVDLIVRYERPGAGVPRQNKIWKVVDVVRPVYSCNDKSVACNVRSMSGECWRKDPYTCPHLKQNQK